MLVSMAEREQLRMSSTCKSIKLIGIYQMFSWFFASVKMDVWTLDDWTLSQYFFSWLGNRVKIGNVKN